jgi:hypothetical protein
VQLKNNTERFANTIELLKQKNLPSPPSYKVLEAYNFAHSPRRILSLCKEKRPCFVDLEAKLNLSPGPAKYSPLNKAFDKTSKGFHTSRTRLT